MITLISTTNDKLICLCVPIFAVTYGALAGSVLSRRKIEFSHAFF